MDTLVTNLSLLATVNAERVINLVQINKHVRGRRNSTRPVFRCDRTPDETNAWEDRRVVTVLELKRFKILNRLAQHRS